MTTATLTPLVRRVELDRLRGLAIVLMVGDHLALVWSVHEYRLTLGRLAVPLFFIVSGHLAGHRLSERHLRAFLIGVALPFLVPWIDSPNVLVWFAVGAVILYVFDQHGWSTWLLIVPALLLAVNGWSWKIGHGYEPLALMAFMALGRGLGPDAFRFGAKIPAWIGAVGRRPLTWYVGHLLLMETVIVVINVARDHA